MHGREGEEREQLSQGSSGETGRMLTGTPPSHLVLVISGASKLQREASLDGGERRGPADQEATGNTHLTHGLLPSTLICYSSLT